MPARFLRGNDLVVARGGQLAELRRAAAAGQARPRSRAQESRLKPINVAVVGVGHLGRIHARILAGAARRFRWSAWSIRWPRIWPATCGLSGAGLSRSARAPGRSMRRDHRHAHALSPPGRSRFDLAAACMCWSKSRWLQNLRRSRANWWICARRPGSVLQVGHVERFNPAFGRRAAASSPRPNISRGARRAFHFARPISASCSI